MIKSLFEKLRLRQPYTETSLNIADPDTFKWDQEVDVAIAGFGGAGAAAALESHAQGLNTLVLDRFEGGGATTISGGIYYAGGGTSIQQQAGVEDSPENMFNYLKLEVQGAVSDATLKDFCDQSVDNFNWMVDNGVPFEASFCPFKTSYPPNQYFFYYSGNETFPPYSEAATPAARGHRGKQKGISGMAIFQPLKESVLSRGIEVKTHTKVVGLCTDKNNKVIGLKAIQLGSNKLALLAHKVSDKLHGALRDIALFAPIYYPVFSALCEWIERQFGESIFIKANKGVVLATGGFFTNQKLVEQYAPQFVGGSPLGTMTDDGSGISLAMNLGAQTDIMDSVSAWRFINPPASFAKGILVGPSGKRICNEMLYGAQVGEQIMKHHDGKGYVIIDQASYQQAWKDLRLDKGLWFHILLGWQYLTLGRKKAFSIRGLAHQLNIDAEQLQQTYEEYNRIAASDELDPMGKPKTFMPPLGEGPYYAINASYDYLWVPCPSLTLGGLKVNESSGLTTRADGSDIEGLYAIGRTAVGIPSRGYVSGLSIADCIYSGRRAARHAAKPQ